MHIAAAIKDIPIMVLLEKHGASMFDALELIGKEKMQKRIEFAIKKIGNGKDYS